MALLLECRSCRQHTVAHPRDGIRQHEGRELTAGEDIIPDGDLLIHDFVQHALIDALVMPAQQKKRVLLR